MCRKLKSRVLIYIFLIAIFFISGCLEENIIYPELVANNTFKLSDNLAGRNIAAIEVFTYTSKPDPLLKPVWKIKAVEKIPAEKIIFVAGIVPHGFVQILPEASKQFQPVEGQEYFVKVVIEPIEKDMLCVLRPWKASSAPKRDTIEDVQPYIHQASQMVFPKYVGLFSRNKVVYYDNTGRDVSVAYNQNQLKGVATVYVFPAVMNNNSFDINLHFEDVKNAIIQSHEKVSLVSNGDFQFKQDDKTYDGLHAAFAMLWETPQGEKSVFSDIYLFRYGKWFIKYRFTYPRESRRGMEKEIEQLMESLVWPDINQLVN